MDRLISGGGFKVGLYDIMSQGYCCLRSILCLSHYLVPLVLYASVKLQRRRHKQISSGSTNHNNFLVIFAAIALKREKRRTFSI